MKTLFIYKLQSNVGGGRMNIVAPSIVEAKEKYIECMARNFNEYVEMDDVEYVDMFVAFE